MKKLIQPIAAGTGTGTKAYIVPTGGNAVVRDMEIANTTAGTLAFTCHFVPSGLSVAATNMLFPSVSIPANSIVQWSGEMKLDSGDFVQVISSGSGLTFHMSGDEVKQ